VGDLTIRRARIDDLDALAPLFDAYRGFYRRPANLLEVRDFLGERLRRGDSVIFIGLLQGEDGPAGFAQLYPVPSSVSLGRAWILNDLFVAPSARGRGLGRALLGAARDHGLETSALYLELMTELSNAAARHLYEAEGWVLDERFAHYELDLHRSA
jgi:GNAT superfamily N-acetyltransferase